MRCPRWPLEANPWKHACLVCVAYILVRKLLPQVLSWCPTSEISGLLGTDLAVIPSESYDEIPWRQYSGRQLAANFSNSSSASSAAHASSSSSGGVHSYPHDALFFFFYAIILGTGILHLTMIPRLHNLQQTVVLFVLGMLWTLLQEGLKFKEHLGVFGRSHDMWMDIDPHLLLFSMLPALLAGDAMKMDTSVARSVAKQCIFLAGPGVLFGSFLTATFLYFYIGDWDFLLCLTTGSILAATDPVAVLSVLKELGAPPILTVQIQGESLLNNGTAIVLFSLVYNMLSGEAYDMYDILIYLVVVGFCAVGLGVVVGWLFLQWIRLACDRADHNAVLVQTALTLSCAYWSFCIAEGFLKISGVLCTVSASLLLADKMWPHVADKHSMLHIWEMIEYLGNTITFFLAGSLFGHTMIDIPAIDYLHLLVIYVVCTLIRGLLLILSRPILKVLSPHRQPVSIADAMVMTWGGLRGAVGLVLGIQVSLNRADGRISEIDGKRVLFYVGGVATLTLVVNATTCPTMVTMLGITRTPKARQQMLYKIFGQLKTVIQKEKPKDAVKGSIDRILDDARNHLDSLSTIKSKEAWTLDRHCNSMTSDLGTNSATSAARSSRSSKCTAATAVTVLPDQDSSLRSCLKLLANSVSWVARMFRGSEPQLRQVSSETTSEPRRTVDICEHFSSARQLFLSLDLEDIRCLDLPRMPFADKEDEYEIFIRENDFDTDYVKSVNTAFLSLVASQYWQQIEAGEFAAGNADAEMLLTSVSLAIRDAGTNLSDLQQLLTRVQQSHLETGTETAGIDRVNAMVKFVDCQLSTQIGEISKLASSKKLTRGRRLSLVSLQETLQSRVKDVQDCWPDRKTSPTKLSRLLGSAQFNSFISIVLVLSAIVIVVERIKRTSENYHHPGWIVCELCFTAIFLVEFLINVAALRFVYFYELWKLFDFVVLIISLFGLAVEFVASNSQRDGAQEANYQETRMVRLINVFRVLRILRVFRLFKFFHILKASFQQEDLSLQLAERLRTVTTFRAFVKAHIESQLRFAELFGENGQFTRAEEARVILESQTEVYRGIALSVLEARDIDNSILDAMHLLRDSVDITQKLSNFIQEVEDSGVITCSEAQSLGQPLEDNIKKLHHQINRAILSGQTSGIEDRYPGTLSCHFEVPVNVNPNSLLPGKIMEMRISRLSLTSRVEEESETSNSRQATKCGSDNVEINPDKAIDVVPPHIPSDDGCSEEYECCYPSEGYDAPDPTLKG